MNKVLAIVGAFALLFATAGAAYAQMPGTFVSNSGFAFQTTLSSSTASTGGNSYVAGKSGGFIVQSGDTTTGTAVSGSLSQSIANQYTTRVSTGCMVCTGATVMNRGGATQMTGSESTADTGNNEYVAGKNSGGIIQNGDTTTGADVSGSTAQSWANIYSTKITSFGFFPVMR